MKYITVVVILILFVRVDVFLGLFDRVTGNYTPPPADIENSDLNSDREIIPVSGDKYLEQTPREDFLALLGSFRISPDSAIRDRAMNIFKAHPTMFSKKLDPQLESNVYRWRELLNNNEPEVVNFLIDLMSILQGENLQMVKRFFALWMDIHMENFISGYSKTKDTNCTIATTFGDPIPEEEKLNEYYEREDFLKALVKKEKLDPAHKALATNCLLVLGIEIEKLAPKPMVQSEPLPDPEAGGLTP